MARHAGQTAHLRILFKAPAEGFLRHGKEGRRDLGDIIPAYEEVESRLAELAKSEGIEVAE